MTFLLFAIAGAALVYTYAGYPLLLYVVGWMSRRRAPSETTEAVRRESGMSDLLPLVTVVVAAHNEAAGIEARAADILAQDYPSERMEVLVGSDGSTDQTVAVVKNIGDPRVRVLDLPRGGRATVHNACAAVARGEILVFTDAGTTFAPDCLRRLVSPFADDRVGCVTGQLEYRNAAQPGVPHSAGTYWRYELLLRGLESAVGSTVGVTGACMALRKRLFRTLAPTDDIDDAAPVNVMLSRQHVAFARDAVAYDQLPDSSGDELAARRRIVTKNLAAIVRRPAILNPVRYPEAAFKLMSHRILRYLSPLFLVLLFWTNALLLGHPSLRALWWGQVIFYGGAVLGFLADRLRWNVPVVSAVFAFCLANIGFLLGVWNTLTGRGVTLYQPIR